MPPRRRRYKNLGSKKYQTTLPELAARQKLAAPAPASTSPPRLIFDAVIIPSAEPARVEPSGVNLSAGEGNHLPMSMRNGEKQTRSPDRNISYSKQPDLQKLDGSDLGVVDVEKSARRATPSDSGDSDEVVTPQNRRRMRRALAATPGGNRIGLRPASVAGGTGKDLLSTAGSPISGKRTALPRASQPHHVRGRSLSGVGNGNLSPSASDRPFNQLPRRSRIATRKRARSPNSPPEGDNRQAGPEHAALQELDDSDVETVDAGESVQKDALDSSSDSEEIMSAQKRRKFRLSLSGSPEENRKAQRPAADEEMQDIEEDLASTANNLVLENRTRLVLNRSKVTFKKRLANLLAKRSAKNAKKPPSAAEAAAETQLNTDDSNTDSDSDADANTGADDSEISEAEDSNTGGDSDSWIINDEDEDAPPVLLPAKFSRQSYTRSIDSFVIFSHHLIQKLLNPEYTPEEESLDLAIEALTRKVDEYTSALQGSTWKPLISRAMKARPVFRSKKCRDDSHCDACNRTNFVARRAVSFVGPRYDKATLDDYEDSDAEDSVDSAGNSVVSESAVFHLGGSCFQRVKTFHNFLHWKKSLRSVFEGILEDEGYFEKANLIPAADRGEWAVGVAESFQEKIEALFNQLMDELKAAKKIMVK